MTAINDVPHLHKRARLMHVADRWIQLTPVCVPFNKETPGVIINPRALPRLNVDTTKPFWVQIDKLVYKVFTNPNFPQSSVGISSHEFLQLPANISTIGVKLFDAEPSDKPMLTKINFEVAYTPIKKDDSVTMQVMDTFNKYVKFFRHQYFRYGQDLTIDFESGSLKFTVMSFVRKNPASHLELNEQLYGFVDNTTLVSLTSTAPNLRLVQGLIECPDAIFCCAVTSVNPPVLYTSASPVLTTSVELRQSFLATYGSGFVQIPTVITMEVPFLGHLSVTLTAVTSPSNPSIHHYAVKLTALHSMIFTSIDPNIKIIDTIPRMPESIDIALLSAEITLSNIAFKPAWISVEELLAGLRRLPNGFACPQQLSLPISGGTAVLAIRNVICKNVISIHKHRWTLSDHTHVRLHTQEGSETIFVNNFTTRPIKALTLSLSAPDWLRHTTLKSAQIIQYLEQHSVNFWVKGFKTPINLTGRNYFVELKVDTIEFEDSLPATPYHQLGNKTAQTQIRLKSGSDSLWIEDRTPNETIARLGSILAENGLSGVPKHITSFLKLLAMSNTGGSADLPEDMPKGILLSGPKGSGKKKLAEFMAELLGIPPLRVSQKDANYIHAQWIGEEHRTRDNFFRLCCVENLRDSPKQVLIISNVHLIHPVEMGDSPEPVLESLRIMLAELATVHNLFVIGTTNSPELVNESVTSLGHLFPHLTLGIPDLESRKAIFDMYLKSESLADDVSIDHLAKSTDGCSRGQVKEIIQKTTNTLWSREAARDESGRIKITSSALSEAIRTTKISRKDSSTAWKDMFI